jgi:hypothetical protein
LKPWAEFSGSPLFSVITESVRFSHLIALRYACSRSNPA